MKYSELVESGTKESEVQSFLVDGNTVPMTIRIPNNLRESAKAAASLRGKGLSAFVRMRMIGELSKPRERS
ncbi:MAG: hypothetical protein J6D54_06820 [Olsenella sp.]|nr:hypothetical protein [Olsenella sp.]